MPVLSNGRHEQIDLQLLPKSKREARAIGSKFFFTGVACKYGHLAHRYATTGHCKVCSVERVKQWWAAQGPGAKKENWREWARDNADHRNAYKRARKAKPNPETRSAWKDQNREKLRASGRRHYRENKEYHLAKGRNRKARQKGAAGSHSREDVARILAKQSGKCAYCKVGLRGKYHVDHVMPLALGGSNFPQNLQVLCQPCNLAKSYKHPTEFARRRGMLL